MMVPLKRFVSQHHIIVAGITMLAIALLANPATAVSPVIGVIL